MRNEDASQAGLNTGATLNARDDVDHLAAADYGPATGNAISGGGTVTGATGTDMVGSSQGRITEIEGAGGSDSSFTGGRLEVQGQYGKLSIDAQGVLYWNDEAIDAQQLNARIATAAMKHPQPELHLRAERMTPYEKVAQVMSAAQNGGLSKIGFITDPRTK